MTTDLNRLSADFLFFMDLEQNCAKNTLKSYRLNLNEFCHWVLAREVEALSRQIIQEYVYYLRTVKRNSPNTIAHKLATLKSFFNYLYSINIDAPRLNTNYKKIKSKVEALSKDELWLLLQATKDKCEQVKEALINATGKTALLKKQLIACCRDILMLTLLAGTGLRISELCALNIGDLDLENSSFSVTGKGYRKRAVYFDLPAIRNALGNYLDVHGEADEKAPLFTALKDGRRLSIRGAQHIFKGYVQTVKFHKKATPHTMRHTFATLSIESGANIKAVSQLLGHSQVGTTLNMYTHLSTEYVRKVFQLCNPFTESALSLEEAVAARRNSLMFLKDTTNHWQRKTIDHKTCENEHNTAI